MKIELYIEKLDSLIKLLVKSILIEVFEFRNYTIWKLDISLCYAGLLLMKLIV